MDPTPEIFDRLFKPDEDDVEWIHTRIEKHLEACRRGLSVYPFTVEEALDEADEASTLALAEGMANIERKVRFYQAECYRRLEEWREAGKLYEECAVDARDEWYLEGMRTLCQAEISRPRKDSRLRRIEVCGDLKDISRPRKDKAEVSRPHKDSRLGHKEGCGNLKEYRKRKRDRREGSVWA